MENPGNSFSLILCTYNPEEKVLERCLNAIYQLENPDCFVELIIVDNNSTSFPSALVAKYIECIPNSSLIRERRQGLTFARIAGAKAAKGNIVVYFDDDNEPDSGYIRELSALFSRYQDVATWGPGKVKVDFLDSVNNTLEGYLRPLFQEKDCPFVEYASIRESHACYPMGTGLSIRKEVLLDYVAKVEKGAFSLSDRTGNSLSSGGDTQIVLFAISSGYAAGIAPTLIVNHVIPTKRLSEKYLKKLVFGINECYYTSQCEIFPEFAGKFSPGFFIPKQKFISTSLRRYMKTRFQSDLRKKLELIRYISLESGKYRAANKPVPGLIMWIQRKLLS